MPVVKKCASCGKEFSIKPSMKQNYCSMVCRALAKSEQVACKQCGVLFTTNKSRHAQYCSISCGLTARNLTDQNPSLHRDMSGKNNPGYGKGLHGKDNPMFGKTREQNPMWKGGRKIRKDGYILVIAPDQHPHAIASGRNRDTRYILEHRFVMEQMLGRYLEPREVVHHINGDTSDNRIENLRLYKSHAEHVKHEHVEHTASLRRRH